MLKSRLFVFQAYCLGLILVNAVIFSGFTALASETEPSCTRSLLTIQSEEGTTVHLAETILMLRQAVREASGEQSLPARTTNLMNYLIESYNLPISDFFTSEQEDLEFTTRSNQQVQLPTVKLRDAKELYNQMLEFTLAARNLVLNIEKLDKELRTPELKLLKKVISDFYKALNKNNKWFQENDRLPHLLDILQYHPGLTVGEYGEKLLFNYLRSVSEVDGSYLGGTLLLKKKPHPLLQAKTYRDRAIKGFAGGVVAVPILMLIDYEGFIGKVNAVIRNVLGLVGG